MGVSANTLFHFTSQRALEGILKSLCFWPNYSQEYFKEILPRNSPYVKCYVPLVSFCDLTISQISGLSRHTNDFGKYGVGLKKDWGEKNGITPVVYVHKRSLPSRNIVQLTQILNQKNNGFGNLEENVKLQTVNKMLDFVKYLKPYKGFWQKRKKYKRKINYYNEREWRFCPDSEFQILPNNINQSKNIAEAENRRLKNDNHLTFTPDDIKFIILNREQDINSFFRVIDDMPVRPQQKRMLKTKVITLKEIKEDYI